MNLEYPQSNCELEKMGLCNVDSWCICEAVEMIQANIEEDLEGLSKEWKKKYFDKLDEKIKAVKKC